MICTTWNINYGIITGEQWELIKLWLSMIGIMDMMDIVDTRRKVVEDFLFADGVTDKSKHSLALMLFDLCLHIIGGYETPQ